MAVGSTGGLAAARRGECDLAGIHLLDPDTDQYNLSFVEPGMSLLRGYSRMQGIVFRPDDARFAGKGPQEAIAAALADPNCYMVNRNRGSGTRVLIDRLLNAASGGGAGRQTERVHRGRRPTGQRNRLDQSHDLPRPPGYWVEVKSHNAVVAAVAQGRADWGVAIEPVARELRLGFIPLREERFDFIVPTERLERPAVREFRQLLKDPETHRALEQRGLIPDGQTGELIG
jgi:putative molybdopterin biosynthesis protein